MLRAHFRSGVKKKKSKVGPAGTTAFFSRLIELLGCRHIAGEGLGCPGMRLTTEIRTRVLSMFTMEASQNLHWESGNGEMGKWGHDAWL